LLKKKNRKMYIFKEGPERVRNGQGKQRQSRTMVKGVARKRNPASMAHRGELPTGSKKPSSKGRKGHKKKWEHPHVKIRMEQNPYQDNLEKKAGRGTRHRGYGKCDGEKSNWEGQRT